LKKKERKSHTTINGNCPALQHTKRNLIAVKKAIVKKDVKSKVVAKEWL